MVPTNINNSFDDVKIKNKKVEGSKLPLSVESISYESQQQHYLLYEPIEMVSIIHPKRSFICFLPRII